MAITSQKHDQSWCKNRLLVQLTILCGLWLHCTLWTPANGQSSLPEKPPTWLPESQNLRGKLGPEWSSYKLTNPEPPGGGLVLTEQSVFGLASHTCLVQVLTSQGLLSFIIFKYKKRTDSFNNLGVTLWWIRTHPTRFGSSVWSQACLALPSSTPSLTVTDFLSLFIYYSRLLHIANYHWMQEKSQEMHSS